jgi:transmembrane sensor
MKSAGHLPSDIDIEASEIFVQRLQGEWTPIDQARLEARLGRDRVFADAYSRAEASWADLDTHAETPELMRYREEAMAYARRANASRWLRTGPDTRSRWRVAAAGAGILVALGVAWQLSPMAYIPGQYRTGIGEQRIVELDDHSRIALDATTRLQVHYSRDARVVELKAGQAQFSVAHDPSRTFKVIAGNRAIIAVGTVFTVEFNDQKIHVAMMEGRVSVVSEASSQSPFQPSEGSPTNSAVEGEQGTRSLSEVSGSPPNLPLDLSSRTPATGPQPAAIELSAGEELRVNEGGQTTVTQKADLEAATAWREGKVIFRAEQLGDAVRRVNRYSRIQIEIDDLSLAGRRINGVFETGDTQGFVDAVERYLPITVDRSRSDRIRLSSK